MKYLKSAACVKTLRLGKKISKNLKSFFVIKYLQKTHKRRNDDCRSC